MGIFCWEYQQDDLDLESILLRYFELSMQKPVNAEARILVNASF